MDLTPPPEGPGPGDPAGRQGLLEFLLERELFRPPLKTVYLFSCRFTRMMRLNMAVLHFLLSERKESGIYVSVDHPHSYTQMALKKKNTPLEGLVYVDAISRLSGTKGEDSQVRFVASGLAVPILDDLFSRAVLPEGSQRHFVRLEDMGFMLFDNLNVALQYSGPEKVKKLMAGLAEQVKKYTSMKLFLVIDPRNLPDMHQYLKGICDRELAVEDEWL